MNKDKIFHPIQYRRDMKRVHELLVHMNDAHEACRKAAELGDVKRFSEQCAIFNDCNSEIDSIWKKWKIGPYGS